MKAPSPHRLLPVVTALVFSIAGAQPVLASRTAVHEAAESRQYKQKFGGMIGRGLLNAVTCFVDVIVQTVNQTRQGPPLIGTLTGFAGGLGCGVLRLGSGAIDVTTFWVPGFNGLPVSDSYENCLTGSASAGISEPSSVQVEPQDLTPMQSEPIERPISPEPEAERQWRK